MSSSTTYSLELEPRTKRLFYFVLSFMTIGGASHTYNAFRSSGVIMMVFILIWWGVLLRMWWMTLSAPVRIDVMGDGRAIFHDILGRAREIALHEIEEIKVNQNILRIAYRGQKLTGMGDFSGFYRFIADVKAANPSLRTKGC